MAKYFGQLGIAEQVETTPGVWKTVIVPHDVYGDFVRDNRNNLKSEQVNDNVKINNQISIVMDAYVMKNYSSIIYVTYLGAKWKINTVELKYPRLLLSMGEVYNG